MYTTVNYGSKAELKRAIAAGTKVTLWQRNGDLHPGPEQTPYYSGKAFLEGPWYPQPHRWYATATVENGIVTKVK